MRDKNNKIITILSLFIILIILLLLFIFYIYIIYILKKIGLDESKSISNFFNIFIFLEFEGQSKKDN